jgi:putative endonuclease
VVPQRSPLGTFVYMLRCADGSYYVGSTRKSLEERLGEHNAGLPKSYTVSRRPVVLVWSQEFEHVTDAIAAERQIKGWNRAKKEALIAGDFDAIRRLASRKNGETPRPSRRAFGPPQDEA